MRFSVRKVVQGIFIVSCVATINLLYILINQGTADSDSRVPQWGQNPGQHGRIDIVPIIPGLGKESISDAKAGRRVSSLSRHERDLDGYLAADEQGRSVRGTGAGQVPHQADTATPANLKPRPTELSDIFISVKTTKKFHKDRLALLLDTWIILAREETYIFTDADDPEYSKKTRGHLINTNCSSVHSRRALCCKMAVEYDYFMESNKRWFCHVDDDTYVNIPALIKKLQQYNHTEDWYLGKPSLNHPIELLDAANPTQKIAFWFATGGAGMCISRALALKMMPYASGGKLMSVGDKIRLPDDCTVGYIINHTLKKDLTIIDGFHSHLEGLWLVQAHDLQNHLTFSYSKYGEHWNIVNIPRGFSEVYDPTRFRSIHCHLFPYLKECPPRLR